MSTSEQLQILSYFLRPVSSDTGHRFRRGVLNKIANLKTTNQFKGVNSKNTYRTLRAGYN